MMAPMALGEAFVAVRADLRPFARDLKRQLKEVVSDFEKQINEQLGVTLERDAEKAGSSAGKGLSRGLNRELGRKNLPIWTAVGSALASALDDGISALPANVKASIVGGILASLPLVGGALTGLVTAALGAGVATLGTLLAFQFEQVQTEFGRFAEEAREILVRSASAFGQELLNVFALARQRIETLEPVLRGIFDISAGFVEPLVTGVFDAVEEILTSIEGSIDNIGGFVKELGIDFAVLGDAIGKAFEILAATGDDGEQALRDIVAITAITILDFARMLAALTHVYNAIRDVGEILGPLTSLLGIFTGTVARVDEGTKGYRDTVESSAPTFDHLLSQTEKQEKAAKDAARAVEEQARAMDQARDAAFSLIDAQIDYEASIDAITESIKENGRTLSFETEQGRANLQAISDAIRSAQRIAEERVASGKLGSEEARAFYDAEIARIIELAAKQGVSASQVKRIFDETIKLVNLPKPDATFWNQIIGFARTLQQETARALANAEKLRRLGGDRTIPFGGGIPEGLADGGIVSKDSIIRAGEGDRPEVVIPLTKPARAAQLAQRSGLTSLLGGAGGTTVQVFVGDEPLEQKMYRVVDGSQRVSSQQLAYGTR